MYLAARDNSVLDHNPAVAINNITPDGSSVAWAFFALHAVILLGVLAWTFIANPRRRVFHYFALLILLVATIYYFVLASNLGSTAVEAYLNEDGIPGRTRQIFYARWIGYFVNFTLVFFALALLSGIDWPGVLFTVALPMAWTVLFLSGALTRSSYKWGFLGLALFVQTILAWQLLLVARQFAARHDVGIRGAFTLLSLYELGLLLLYVIAWGVSEAGNHIANDSTMVFYGILDVLSQGVFALLLIWQTRSLDLEYLRLAFDEYGRLGSVPPRAARTGNDKQ